MRDCSPPLALPSMLTRHAPHAVVWHRALSMVRQNNNNSAVEEDETEEYLDSNNNKASITETEEMGDPPLFD